MTLRTATTADAAEVALLLHDFNTEFGTETPGSTALGQRLEHLLARDDVVALLGTEPDTAVALMTFRPNVWCDGPVVLLDELFVRPHLRSRGIGAELLALAQSIAQNRGAELFEINIDEPDHDARRFYERHGFSCTEPGTEDRCLYYWQEL